MCQQLLERIYDLAVERGDAWKVIDAAKTEGVREELGRRLIWFLVVDQRLILTSERRLVPYRVRALISNDAL